MRRFGRRSIFFFFAFVHQEFEVLVGKGARVHLAEAEADAMLVGVDADDAQGLHVAVVQNFLGMLDAMVADLGDVDETFEVAFETGERTELGQAGDDAFDQLPDAEFIDLGLPGVFLEVAD